MKKQKSAVVFAALLTLVGFSSCLNSNDDYSNYPSFRLPVTITGDALVGYTFLSDIGENIRLRPTTESVSQLNLEGVKRAVIAFDLSEDQVGVTQLESNRIYTVVVNPTYCYSIPAYSMAVDTLSTQYQENGNDSIALKCQQIVSASNTAGTFYVKNGYMTFVPTFLYGQTPLYWGLYYDSQKDVDVDNGVLKMNLYFNNSLQPSQGSSAFSMISLKMPTDLYGQYRQTGKDSIDFVLNYNSSSSSSPVSLECRMAVSDFITPTGY